MMRAAIVLLVVAVGCSDDPEQLGDVLVAVPACGEPILASLDNSDAPSADSMGYLSVTAGQLSSLRASFTAFDSGLWRQAVHEARDAGYELCDDAGLSRWRPQQPRFGRATIVWQNTSTALIVGAPHAQFETNTLAEAKLLFEQLRARVLIVSGTHRCANAPATSCSGTSSVCGASGPYRVSDMAHVVDSSYQLAHEVFAAQHSADLVVSLHGMSAAGVSISNGTTGPVADDSAVARLAAQLSLQFPADNITTCNSYAGANVDERLCGITNAQGRAINGSIDACAAAATSASERFIHLEQSLDVRSQRQRVVDAFTALLQ